MSRGTEIGCWDVGSQCKLVSIEADGTDCRLEQGIVGNGALRGVKCVGISGGWVGNKVCE